MASSALKNNANTNAQTENEIQKKCDSSYTRYFLLFYILLCLTAIWCNILTFNIAILCTHPHRHLNASVSSEEIRMAQENLTVGNVSTTSVELVSNLIEDTNDPSVLGLFIEEIIWYTPHDKSLLISAVAVGALLAHFPVVWLIDHFGIRIVLGPLGLLSAIATFLIPFAARIGLFIFIAARLIQGIAFAANFSVIGSFITKWTPIKQSGLFLSILVACLQLSPVITMPIGGYVCTNYSWPYIYFGHGAVSLLLFICFIIIYRNSPNKHPLVSATELKKIDAGKELVSKKEMRSIPYVAILTTASIWAIWIAALALTFCDNIIFFFAPTFLHAVLGFQVNDSGLTAAIPPLLQIGVKIGCGSASDKIHFLNDNAKLKLFNSLAFFGCAVCLILLGFMSSDEKIISLILLSLSTAFLGVTTGGCLKAAPLVARHYAAFVTGNISLAMSFTMLLVPITVSNIAPDNTPLQWRYIFLSSAVLLICANGVFILFGSATPAIWAFSNNSTIEASMRMKNIRCNDDTNNYVH